MPGQISCQADARGNSKKTFGAIEKLAHNTKANGGLLSDLAFFAAANETCCHKVALSPVLANVRDALKGIGQS